MTMDQKMSNIRSWRERATQTLAYEIGGLAFITPLFAVATNYGLAESMALNIALSLMFLIWTFFHNWTFDLVEQRFGAGPASDRSHRLRVLHALSLEITSAFVTLPMIMWMVGLTFWEALLVDIGLSVACAIYTYLFFLAFDWIRPVSA